MKTYDDFKYDLGSQESSNNYNSDNHLNSTCCWGYWQFSAGRLNDLQNNYNLTPWISKSNFLGNSDLQNLYFDQHVQDYAGALTQYLVQAQSALGSTVTLSGLIAGAHLGGLNGVLNLITNGIDNADSNGTAISSYVNTYSGYTIPGYDESGSNSGDGSGDGGSQASASGAGAAGLIIAAIIIGLTYYYTTSK